MFKKMLLGTMLILNSAMAYAGEVEPLTQPNWDRIPYVGAQFGFGGSYFAGYGKTFGKTQRVYLGGEVSLNAGYPWYPYGAGVSIIPGILLTNETMLYARLGAEVSGEMPYVAGLGLQTQIYKNFDLRGEFNSDNLFAIGLVYKFK